LPAGTNLIDQDRHTFPCGFISNHDKAASQFQSEFKHEGVPPMARAIIAVVVSYLLMFVLVFVAFTCMYLLLGADGAFKPGSYDASSLWTGLAFVVDFVIAIIAGWICVAIAKTHKASLGLAITVFVLGMLLAIPAVMVHNSKPDMVRSGSVSNMEAMQRAKQPIWVSFVFPFIGAAGALIGGKLKRRA
jgi:hypothetical protein